MKISELSNKLETLKLIHGDLNVLLEDEDGNSIDLNEIRFDKLEDVDYVILAMKKWHFGNLTWDQITQ